jgi:predicted dehydrogenase/threonine dehydrogenase-like Zn-dependent dehydrogenase
MKQVIQNMKDGKTSTIQIPYPSISSNQIIIKTKASLISSGTEKMLVDFGKSSYIGKAKQQPEKVKMVLEKLKTDGFSSTYESVKSKLNQPLPLGYSNVGEVLEVGSDVEDFKAGDIVISNGPHAEICKVSKNLCAKVPAGVDIDSAAFVVLASIALQGIRLAIPTIGEKFVVMGAGLIGLLTVQILVANGCKVLALDFDSSRLKLAEEYGAETFLLSEESDPVKAGLLYSNGKGVDGVIITATTQSDDPIKNAANMSRQRGRIILIGVVGLHIDRSDFYEKELTFQVSCSYGPGRYDDDYEKLGNDYPFGFVRWTEQRNFTAILDLMESGKINVSKLISHKIKFERVAEAYELLTNDKDSLGLLLQYSPNQIRKNTGYKMHEGAVAGIDQPILAVIGAGNYASRVLIPSFKNAGAIMHTLVTQGSIDGTLQAQKHEFMFTDTDIDNVLNNKEINTVIVATRHNTHSTIVAKAILANKNVFVEKPLSISKEGLEEIRKAIKTVNEKGLYPMLMVGYNRRFSKYTKKIKELLQSDMGPKSFNMTMNAGFIDPNHWTQNPSIGGGRIVGEACHYIDLMRFLCGSKIKNISSQFLKNDEDLSYKKDTAIISISFEDGSVGVINYFSNGSPKFMKEIIEVYSNAKILKLENFNSLKGYGYKKFKKISSFSQDKGQATCINEFVNAIKTGEAIISINEIFEVAEKTLDIISE